MEETVSAADRMEFMLFLSVFFLSLLQLLELIAKSKLPSLSGVAQKNYMNILERVVQKGETCHPSQVTELVCLSVSDFWVSKAFIVVL